MGGTIFQKEGVKARATVNAKVKASATEIKTKIKTGKIQTDKVKAKTYTQKVRTK
jgi:hypothetical protein